jgi:NAD(P)-dependent dehydrogenase (short-subunit alcohol dehydrogenase family)
MVSLPLQGRTVAITGASGSLGQALLRQLHQQGASLVALTSRSEPLDLCAADGSAIPLRQVTWRCGQEQALEPVLADCDLLVINHGFNSHGDRSAEAIERSLEVNAHSSWRLLELFARLAHADPPERPQRELWVNTSEAEIQAAVSPLYELSKRLQGQLLSLRSLDLAGPKLRIRRLVLGPFRSALNPIGVMDAGFVAREILRQVGWNCSLVIVTPNPLTYVLMPLATVSRWLYFSLVSRPSP